MVPFVNSRLSHCYRVLSLLGLAALVCAAAPISLRAQSGDAATMTAVSAAVNVSSAGLALKGFDPVAYFTVGEPTKGTATFATTWQGAAYHFANAANRDAFAAAPEKYAPQYGGYCAMGVAGGAKFDIDPTAWRVENGRLYLNKDKRTQTAWLRDVPGNIVKADLKWPTVAKTKMR